MINLKETKKQKISRASFNKSNKIKRSKLQKKSLLL